MADAEQVWVPLRDVPAGVLFLMRDATLSLKTDVASDAYGQAACLWIRPGLGARRCNVPEERPVRPLDLPALLASHDEAIALRQAFADVRQDGAGWVEHGARMERAAVLESLESLKEARWATMPAYRETVEIILEDVAKLIASRGPVVPRLPVDTLVEENNRLREQVERLKKQVVDAIASGLPKVNVKEVLGL